MREEIGLNVGILFLATICALVVGFFIGFNFTVHYEKDYDYKINLEQNVVKIEDKQGEVTSIEFSDLEEFIEKDNL